MSIEIVANIIVHREYTNAHPCTFVIKKGRVETENANNAHGEGLIDFQHFVPFPKNSTLAKFFIQLGRVDELGSGVINVNRFIQEYADDGRPTFTEGHTFKMIIPIPAIEEDVKDIEGAIEGAIEGVSKGVKEKLVILLSAIAANEGNRTPYYKDAVCHRFGKNGYTPYIVKKFPKEILSSVMIGPISNSRKIVEKVKFHLTKFGYDNVIVNTSRIPYRG